MQNKNNILAPGVIDELIAPCQPLSPDSSRDEVISRFSRLRENAALPVVANGKLVGSLHWTALHSTPGPQAEWSVGKAMQPQCPVILSGTRLIEASRLISERKLSLEAGYLAVVSRDGAWLGMVRTNDLLHWASRFWPGYQRYNHPLSQLPGSVPVHETIDRLLRRDKLFVVVHCDINHFKCFNDTYGYARGDEVILFVASLLQSHIDREADMIGHIRGDDFVIVFQSPDWFDRCEAIERDCALRAPTFYTAMHRAENGITAIDRQGRKRFSPFFSLSLGVIQVEPGKFRSHHEIIAAAAEVKQRAKSTLGGAIYIDERSYSNPDASGPALRN